MKKYNRKQLIILGLIGILIVSVLAVCIFFLVKYLDNQKKERELLSSIKDSYGEYVVVNKNTDLYVNDGKKFIKAGTTYKGTVLNLTEVEIIETEDKYFNIKGTEYYIYYDKVQPVDGRDNDDRYKMYIDFNSNITTTDGFKMYIDEDVIIEINDPLSLPIKYKDDENYYVDFNDMLVRISEDNVEEVIEAENTEELETEKISVLHYQTIGNSCSGNRCISEKLFNEHLDYLNDNDYILITLSEYIAWRESNIRLPLKSVLLVSDEKIEADGAIINTLGDSGLKLFPYNIVSTKESKNTAIHSYKVLSTTNIDALEGMINGETLATETSSSGAASIAVLNYHFLYDKSKGEKCYRSICLEVTEFEKHLKYLYDNGFKTLTIEEFRAWMYGEIELPKKSVLITVDDAWQGSNTHLPRLLAKYNQHATVFIITGRRKIENYVFPNIDLQSHGHDIHTRDYCKGPRWGYKALCISRDELLEDLRKSIEMVDSDISFCHPFYIQNAYLNNALKEA